MRTNKACPLYSSSGLGGTPSLNVALTEEQEEEEYERQFSADDQDLVNVEGTKLKLSGKFIKVSTVHVKDLEMILPFIH